MDKLTLSPDEDGYSFKDGIETLRTQQGGGSGRYRLDIVNAAIMLQVTWTCDATEYEYLRTAYRTHVSEGHAPFPIDLFIDTATLVEHNVRIMPGSFGLMSHSGLSYVVTAAIEVQPTRKLLPTEALAKLLLPPDSNGYGFTDQAEAIHVETRGGLGRVRRDQIGMSTKINVRWVTNALGFLYLRNFYRAWVMQPVDGFAVDLIIDSASAEEYTGVRFVPGTMGLNSVKGETYEVSAMIEVPSDEALPVPPSAAYFFDDFLEAGLAYVDLNDHTPDVAPSGFVWAANVGAEEDNLQVTPEGASDLRNTDVGLNDLSHFSNEAPGSWVPMPVGAAWRMEMRVRAYNGNSEYSPGAAFSVLTLADGTEVFIEFTSIGESESSACQLSVGFSYGESIWTAVVFGFAEDVFTSIVLHIDADGIYATANGSFALALGVPGSALANFAAMRQVFVAINNDDEDDSAIDSIGVYPNSTPVAATVARIKTGLQYGFEYQTHLGDDVPPDEYPDGDWIEAGSGVNTSLDNKYADFTEQNQTAGGQSNDLEEGNYVAVEFVVEKVKPGDTVAVGLFPVGGPPFNAEAAFGGWESLVAYWNMNGMAGGYGDTDNVEEPFNINDVIGVVYSQLGETNDVLFFKNGVYKFTYLPLNTNVRPFATVVPNSDPYWNNVALLLHFNEYPTLDDASNNDWEIATANINQDTEVYRFGGSAIRSSGEAGGGQTVVSTPADTLFSKNLIFTLEFFLNVSAFSDGQYFCAQDATQYFNLGPSGALNFTGSGMSLDFGTLENDRWYHVALSVGIGTDQAFAYLDGERVATGTLTTATVEAQSFGVTSVPGRSDIPCLNGLIDELRYTTVARYTDASFTVPRHAYPNIAP